MKEAKITTKTKHRYTYTEWQVLFLLPFLFFFVLALVDFIDSIKKIVNKAIKTME